MKQTLTFILGLVVCSFAQAGVIIPSTVWGAGGGGVSLDVEGYYGSGYYCNIAGVGECTQQISASGGSAYGHAIAFVDATGIHGEINTSATGTYSVASGNPGATIGDTVTNNTAQPFIFSFTFTIDGEFDRSGGGSSYVELIYSNITPFDYKEFDGPTGGGTVAAAFAGTFQPTAFTVYPGQHLPWSLTVGFHATSKGPGSAYCDILALNTVAIGGVTLTDTDGNPLPLSYMTSSNGFDYSSASTAATPEPGSWVLLLTGLLLLLRRTPSV